MKKAKLLILGFGNLQYEHLMGMDRIGQLFTTSFLQYFPVHFESDSLEKNWKEQMTGIGYDAPEGFRRKYFWEHVKGAGVGDMLLRSIGEEDFPEVLSEEGLYRKTINFFNEFCQYHFENPVVAALLRFDFMTELYSEGSYLWFQNLVTAIASTNVAECIVVLSNHRDGVIGITGSDTLSRTLRNHGHIKGTDVFNFLCKELSITQPQENEKWAQNALTL